jgi:hypothetical protein
MKIKERFSINWIGKITFFGLFVLLICSFKLVGDDDVALNEFANCTIRFSISAILTLFKVSCTVSKAVR